MKGRYRLAGLLLLVLFVGLLPTAKQYLQELTMIEGHGQTSKTPIVMYSTRWCPYCYKAREYFKRHQFSYFEYDIEASAQNLADFRALNGQGVPLILVGNQRMQGFNPQSFEAMLK